jgi:hypothetical protein
VRNNTISNEKTFPLHNLMQSLFAWNGSSRIWEPKSQTFELCVHVVAGKRWRPAANGVVSSGPAKNVLTWALSACLKAASAASFGGGGASEKRRPAATAALLRPIVVQQERQAGDWKPGDAKAEIKYWHSNFMNYTEASGKWSDFLRQDNLLGVQETIFHHISCKTWTSASSIALYARSCNKCISVIWKFQQFWKCYQKSAQQTGNLLWRNQTQLLKLNSGAVMEENHPLE